MDTAHAQLCLQATTLSAPPPLSNQMLDSLEGYLNNIAAAETLEVANGGPIAELSASLAVLVDIVDTQAK